MLQFEVYTFFWSGKRDSNSRPQPWQGCALPLSYSRLQRSPIIQVVAINASLIAAKNVNMRSSYVLMN